MELHSFQSKIISLQNRPVAAEIELQHLHESTSTTIHELQAQITFQDIKISLLKHDLLALRRNHQLLQKKYHNLKISSRKSHAIAKAKHDAAKKSGAFNLWQKGVI